MTGSWKKNEKSKDGVFLSGGRTDDMVTRRIERRYIGRCKQEKNIRV